LSSISVLTEKPDRIRKLFVSDKANKNGIYKMNLTKNGVKVIVTVDDFIPCRNGKPAFTRANGSELWVLLLEKAFAKLHGSYERIIGGAAHETMRDISGAPGHWFDSNDDGAFDKIQEADESNYIMTAGVDPED
jgi:calpain-15